MWNSETLEELQARDFGDVSAASAKRLEEMVLKVSKGMNITEQWTMYPKGQAKTVHMNVGAIRMSADDDHPSLLCEGIPLLKEELVQQTLRGVEMLRHLPMAVCQFDMSGQVMFQNPEATLKDHVTEEEHKESDDTSANTTDDDNRSTTSATTTSAASTASTSTAIAGALLNRFVDPEVGKRLLKTMQSTDEHDIEAMIYTRKGKKWSAIKVRRGKDPGKRPPH